MRADKEIKQEVEMIKQMSDAKLGKFMIKKFMEVFILWMLKKSRMHGFGIIKTMQKEGMHRATASNIYPTLAALVKKGYLKGIEEKKGGRRKKYYKTTLKGRAVLKAGKRWFLTGLKKEFFQEMVG